MKKVNKISVKAKQKQLIFFSEDEVIGTEGEVTGTKGKVICAVC